MQTANFNNTVKIIRKEEQRGVLTLQIFRPEANNSINTALITQLLEILKNYEQAEEIKVIVLEGLPDHFCSGMDFKAVAETDPRDTSGIDLNGFYELLKHLSLSAKVIISKVEGKVNAGGIGLVAASDIVLADEKAVFSLSEILFGLLPACVLPFLIRRIGYQKALWMTITTQGISAQRAYQLGLVDEVCVNVNDALRKNLIRLTRLEPDAIKGLKSYMSQLWIMNEETQRLAVDKITSLLNTDKVRSNIENFAKSGRFPWER
jgi:polyketide biosynthesis enoyl-CoA hydratase PksH